MTATTFSRRQLNLGGAIACAAMMAFAIYAERVLGLLPCNMCILERIGVSALGVAFLLAALHNPASTGARVYGLLIAVVAAIGTAVAARHVWMQMQPVGSLGSCGADFSAMLEMMSPVKAVKRVLMGGAECQAITWTLFGVSMPVWVVISSAALGVAGLVGNSILGRPAR